jgi:site-specific recombinase XerD
MMAACFKVSASLHTRRAYWADACRWLEFCDERGQNPAQPGYAAVEAWMAQMAALAPKTRARRMAALASIYDRLRRDGKLTLPVNPFSVADGPAREKVVALHPTPIADPRHVQAAIDVCDDSPDGLRDAAILRVLWATGARRSSLTSMTFDKLRREREGYMAIVFGKGGKQLRLFIPGKAAAALDAWLGCLRNAGITDGSIWRMTNGATLVEKDIWKIVRRRAKQAGVEGTLSPHTFRVAFLTLNPADLAAKQDAAGHSDPATTRQYDRQWRGRGAFESMPEVEEAVDDES